MSQSPNMAFLINLAQNLNASYPGKFRDYLYTKYPRAFQFLIDKGITPMTPIEVDMVMKSTGDQIEFWTWPGEFLLKAVRLDDECFALRGDQVLCDLNLIPWEVRHVDDIPIPYMAMTMRALSEKEAFCAIY